MPGRPLPKVPKQHWLLKNLRALQKDVLGFTRMARDEYGPIVDANMILFPVCYIQDPEYVRHVLTTNNKNYIKSFDYDLLKMFLGLGLLTNEGESWLTQRRLIQPAFHREQLAGFLQTMVAATDNMLHKWEGLAASKATFDLAGQMMDVTAGVVSACLFSAGPQEDSSDLHSAVDFLNHFAEYKLRKPLSPPLWFPTKMNRGFRKASKTVDDYILGLVRARRKSGVYTQDLMSTLMQVQDADTGARMNDQQLRDELVTLYVAGHETTSNALCYIFYLLSRHPDVRNRLVATLDAQLQGRAPTLEDLRALPYLDQVINEAMRLYPPAWAIGRKTLADDEIGGYHIPKGMNVYIFPWHLHRDPRLWEAPEHFDPDRFADPKSIPKYAYIPFGGGPRLCVGNNFALMEMKVILAIVLQRFYPRLTPGYELELETLVTLKPKGGMPMVLA